MKKADASKLVPKPRGRVSSRADTQGAATGPDAVPVIPRSTTGQTGTMVAPKLAAGASKRLKGL